MNFKGWISLNENIDSNWNFWCDTLEKYAKKNIIEKRILNSLKDIFLPSMLWGEIQPAPSDTLFDMDQVKSLEDLTLKDFLNFKGVGYTNASITARIILRVLKSKNLENYNWFCFSLGCIISYNGNMGEEDLESAIDETKRRIGSRELTKNEIGAKGWLVVGSESKNYVDEAILRSQELSKRKQLKLKKQGITLDEDPELIKIFAQKNNFILYFCPKLKNLSFQDDKANKRHAILCKYGKGGKFCTANPTGTHHRMYIDSDIYIFHVNNKVKYQFVSCDDLSNHQFHDIDNKQPNEIEKEEKQFLIDSNAPIDCYVLKTSEVSYEQFLQIIKNYPKNSPGWRVKLDGISVNRIQNYLVRSLENKEDTLLLIKAILEDVTAPDSLRDAMNIGVNPMLDLEDFFNILKDKVFCQEVIEEIIKHFEKEDNIISIFTFSTNTLNSMVGISNIKNLEKLLNFKRVANSFNADSFIKILKSEIESKNERVKILSKVETLPSEIMAYLIAISENKKEICDNLRASGAIERLSSTHVIDLLKGTLDPLKELTWRGPLKNKLPGVEIKIAGREMAIALGKTVLDKIKDPAVEARMAVDRSNSRWASMSDRESKNLLEGLCMHPNLTSEDISSIMFAYKKLGVHKWKEKISSFLGGKNLKKLTRTDRSIY
jgi:hypothetical protein